MNKSELAVSALHEQWGENWDMVIDFMGQELADNFDAAIVELRKGTIEITIDEMKKELCPDYTYDPDDYNNGRSNEEVMFEQGSMWSKGVRITYNFKYKFLTITKFDFKGERDPNSSWNVYKGMAMNTFEFKEIIKRLAL